jgi:hypothetical protein
MTASGEFPDAASEVLEDQNERVREYLCGRTRLSSRVQAGVPTTATS